MSVFTGQGIEVKVGVIMAVNNPRGEFKVLFTVAKIINKSSQKQGEG